MSDMWETLPLLGSRALHLSARAKKKPDWNIKLAQYYAAGLCGIIAIFVVLHWTRVAYKKWGRQSRVLTPLVGLTRRARRQLLRPVPYYPSAGHLVTLALYYGVNLVALVVRYDRHDAEAWGKRVGWICVGNTILLVVLAMKNNLIGYVTGYTYERLQVLHRTAGYTTIFQMLLHMILYCVAWKRSGELHKLKTLNMVMGITAGCAMFVMLLLNFALRRRRYELFYVTHVFLFLLAIATLGRHRPTWAKAVPSACILAVCLWFLDRLARAGRLAFYALNNTATLTAVPGDATRVVLRKPLRGARPGQHCYLWVPAVRALETHPFTIVANGPGGLELVANKRAGFTEALYRHALSAGPAGSVTVRASADGPYGTFPDVHSYDRIVLVAGGSGATFTFGLATHLAENLQPGSRQKLDFVWAVRKHERLAWFRPHLDTVLRHGTHIATTVHVTAEGPLLLSPVDSEQSLASSPTEKDAAAPTAVNSSQASSSHHTLSDDEKAAAAKEDTPSSSFPSPAPAPADLCGLQNIRYEKLRAADTVQTIVAGIAPDQRVLVAACGPAGLIEDVRRATAACIRPDGPSIELHYESFDW